MNKLKFRKTLALVVVFMFMFTSVAAAAVPSNTIIVGENAVNIDHFIANPTDVLALLQADIEAELPVYVYTEGAKIFDVFTNNEVTQQAIDTQVKYFYDAQGNKTTVGGVDVAEVAVAAYEAAPITTWAEITTAEGLKAPADAAVAAVTTTATKEAFTARITAKTTAIATKKVELTVAVTSVSAINTTIVEVEFSALAVAKEDVTLEVKDSEGNIVEVVAQDLAKGATSAQFDFTKAVNATDLTGVWSVNGTEFSFTAIEQLADITAAAAIPDQVALSNALTAANITDVKADLMGSYVTGITTANPAPASLADIQKIVDDANAASVDLVAQAAIVKTVVEAKSQLALYTALQANFARVNSAWAVSYASGVSNGAAGFIINTAPANNTVVTATYGGATAVTFANIQTAIDSVNAVRITAADLLANTSVKQAAVTALIQNWVEADDVLTPLVTPKADAIEASEIVRLGFVVAEATTENSLYNALVGYANATPDATLKASELNVNLKAFYLAQMNATAGTKRAAAVLGFTGDNAVAATTYDYKTLIVAAVDAVALDDVVVDLGADATTLVATDNATNRAAFTADLQKLASYTSHKTALNEKFLMSTIDSALLVDYATQMDFDPIAAGSSVSDVQGSVSLANHAATISGALDVVNNVDSTSVQVKNALIDIAIEIADGTTDVAFLNLSAQAQLEIAELVVEARPASPGYADLDALILLTGGTGAIQNAMIVHAAELDKFNAIGNLDPNPVAPTAVKTKAELDTYAYAPYVALTNTEKLAVATKINSLTKMVGTVVTPLDFSGDDAVTTLKAANTIIDVAIAAL